MSDDPPQLSAASILATIPKLTVQALGPDEGGVALRLDTGEMYTLNDTALEFVRRLDGRKSIGDVAGDLVEIFDAEPSALLADLVEVAHQLVGESLLEVVT